MQLSSSMTTMPPEPMDGTQLRQRLVVHRVSNISLGMQPPRAAGLHRLDVAAVGAAFAHIVDEGLERRAQRHLHQARVGHLAHERKHFGAGALGAAGLSEPGRTLIDDGRHVCTRSRRC